MRIAMETAEEARERFGADLEQALSNVGVRLLVRRLAGRLREIYFGDFIVLADSLSESERRELAAHGLGHHLLHAGNHWHQQTRTYTAGNYQERQADVFAAFFLVPEEELLTNLGEPHDLAERFGIPEPFAHFRLSLHQARMEALR